MNSDAVERGYAWMFMPGFEDQLLSYHHYSAVIIVLYFIVQHRFDYNTLHVCDHCFFSSLAKNQQA